MLTLSVLIFTLQWKVKFHRLLPPSLAAVSQGFLKTGLLRKPMAASNINSSFCYLQVLYSLFS